MDELDNPENIDPELGEDQPDDAPDDEPQSKRQRSRSRDFNPYHKEKGQPDGGQFAHTPAGDAPSIMGPNRNEQEYDQFVQDTMQRGFTDDERAAIHEYTNQGYAAINESLRAGTSRNNRPKGMNQTIDELDTMTYESSLPKSVKTYRAASPRTMEMLKSKKNGDLIWDEGFTSVSSSKTSVKEFIRKERGNSADIIEVHLPKGARATPIAKLSSHGEENEILVARKSIYSVHSDGAGKKYLRLEKSL